MQTGKVNDYVMNYNQQLLGVIKEVINVEDDDGYDEDEGRSIIRNVTFYRIKWFNGTSEVLTDSNFELVTQKDYPCKSCNDRKEKCHYTCKKYIQAKRFKELDKYYYELKHKLDDDSWAKGNLHFRHKR